MNKLLIGLCILLTGMGITTQQDGCGEEDPSPTPTDISGILQDGCGHQVVVGTEPFSLRLETETGELVSELGPGGLRIGSVPEIDPGYNYDPYYFYQVIFPEAVDGPDGLEWLNADRVLLSSESEGALNLTLELSNGALADLTVTASCPSSFNFSVNAQNTPTAYVGIDFSAPQGERYYGLGEYLDEVQHRGHLRAMQFEVALESEHGYNEAHVPVPFLISTTGWGLFVEDHHPGIFDVAHTDQELVRVEFGSQNLNWHWMAAEQPKELIKTYTGLSGPPIIPPIWAFAPIQWRDEVSGQEMVLEDARAIRDNDIPGGGIWLDRPYATYVTSMDFDASMYSDPDAMVEELHSSGYELAGWCAPYLNEEDPSFQTALEQDWFVGGYTTGTSDFGWMMDLSNPEASDFWSARVSDAIDRGFMGWKLDWGEDILSGVGDEAMQLSFYNGETAATMHHHFSDYYHQAFLAPYLPDDVFLISRTGTYGGQARTSVIWPGDLCNNFTYYAEDSHVGGLPAAMIAGLSLSASGYPFYASDTGGYNHGRASSEVLIRWAEYSAFLPIMQYGGCGGETTSCNPWDMSDHGDDTYTQETLETFRTYAQIHTELFPFFYGLAERARDSFEPPVLPFGLYWPSDGHHPNDEMVVGDAMLLAPIVREGTERSLYIPRGRFVDFITGNEIVGPAELTVEASLDQVPLYLIEGAIIPMLRPGVDTLGSSQDASIDAWGNDAGRVWGYVLPSPDGSSFELPFDGGSLWASRDAASVSVGFAASAVGSRFEGLNLRVYAPETVAVSADGVSLPEVEVGESATCELCWAREEGSPWIWVASDSLTDIEFLLDQRE